MRPLAVVLAVVALAGACRGGDGPSSPASTTTTTARVLADGATAPPPGVLFIAGDVGVCGVQDDEATAEVVARELAKEPTALVGVAGDLAYDRGTEAEFRDCYGPSWGRFKDRTRPAPGNHEYGTGPATGYWRYWGEAAGPERKGWYSYDLGPWRVVVLNSNCGKREVGGCGPESEQGRWLAAELAAAKGKCTLGYWHHPRWSSGAHGTAPEMEPVWRLAVEGGMDVIVNGHDHHYERFGVREGVRQFVVGTGGASRYPVVKAEEGSEVRNSQTHGVLKLTLHADRYDWRFLPVAGKTFTDAGTSPCAP